MPEEQFAADGAALAGKLYVMGGRTTSFTLVARTSAYDSIADTWTRRASLSAARAAIAARRVVRNGQPRIEVVSGLRPGSDLQSVP